MFPLLIFPQPTFFSFSSHFFSFHSLSFFCFSCPFPSPFFFHIPPCFSHPDPFFSPLPPPFFSCFLAFLFLFLISPRVLSLHLGVIHVTQGPPWLTKCLWQFFFKWRGKKKELNHSIGSWQSASISEKCPRLHWIYWNIDEEQIFPGCVNSPPSEFGRGTDLLDIIIGVLMHSLFSKFGMHFNQPLYWCNTIFICNEGVLKNIYIFPLISGSGEAGISGCPGRKAWVFPPSLHGESAGIQAFSLVPTPLLDFTDFNKHFPFFGFLSDIESYASVGWGLPGVISLCPAYLDKGSELGRLWVRVCVRMWLSHVPLFATPWTVAHQVPLSMEFSRQEYWSGLPFSSPEDLHNSGIKPRSLALQADSLPSEPPGKPQVRG